MDWSSINEYWWALFALVIAGLIIVLKGFFGEAGKDLWAIVKPKIWPGNPEPKKVSRKFVAPDYPQESCIWARDEKAQDDKLNVRLAEGYSYYLDPATGSRVFSVIHSTTGHEVVQYLLVKPGAKKFATTD